MAELEHSNWAGTTYGSGRLHRWLINALKIMDIKLLYLFAYIFVLPPTMIINHKAVGVIYDYFRRQHKYGRMRAAWNTYRNHCFFSQVVIDRFAMYAGKRFKIEIDGYEYYEELSKGKEGFILLSSHIGNYEIAGYSLISKDKKFNAMVFGGEKDSIMANRVKMFADSNIGMIIMKPDMSHIFEVNMALSNGEILSMPADRIFGSAKNYKLNFLNGEAKFPQGPFILGASKNVPMLFVAVMKKNTKTYMIHIRKLEGCSSSNTREQARELAIKYAGFLEDVIKIYPEQWYNYYSFWKSDGL